MSIGEKIKELRLARGLSLSKAARLAGLHKAAWFEIETGATAKPSFWIICDISDFLGISMDELKKVFRESQKQRKDAL